MGEPDKRGWTWRWTWRWTWTRTGTETGPRSRAGSRAGSGARTRTGAVAAVLGAVVVLGGVQGSAADVQTVEAVSDPTRICHGTQPKGSLAGRAEDGVPADTPLDRTVGHVDELATGRHASIFTGMVLDEDSTSLDVYRIPSPPFDEAVCEAAEKGVTVRLHDRDINEQDLTALLDRVTEDMSRWDGTFALREASLDGTGDVVIGVDDPDTAEPILRKAYGERNAKYLRVEYAAQAYLQ